MAGDDIMSQSGREEVHPLVRLLHRVRKKAEAGQYSYLYINIFKYIYLYIFE